MDRLRGVRAWGPVGVWGVVILHALTRTTFGPLKPLANEFTSPLAHLILWAVLGALVARALRMHGHRTQATWWIGLAVCIAYGILTEAVQAVHPVRAARVIDVVYDTAGAIVGLGLWLVVIQRRKRPVTLRAPWRSSTEA